MDIAEMGKQKAEMKLHDLWLFDATLHTYEM